VVEQGIGVLIVEDDSMVAFLLENAVSSVEGFSMLGVATSLEEMFRVLEEQPVNLVLLDIYLGSQNGLEGLRRIRTKHDGVDVIVVSSDKKAEDVALTARLGVFDYITKPFSFEFLELRIRMLIEQRMRLRKQYQQNFDLQPSGISITSLDEKFLQKIKHITETNMHEPDFSVEKLSSEFGISRAHLYNKLVALTGKTPIEFIRILRIRRAAQLLEKSQLTVMEIAYKVGFNDPRYFTKHFKNEYRMTPSQYAKKHFQPADNTFTEL